MIEGKARKKEGKLKGLQHIVKKNKRQERHKKESPASTLRPAGCAALNDDIFHFVGFSFGPDEGEQIFQDGAEPKPY